MSFDSQPMHKGEPVWDERRVYWARLWGRVYWCAPNGPADSMEYKPWPYPEWDEDKLDEPDWHAHFQEITGGAGWAYDLYIEAEEVLPEGVAFRHDPQVGIGYGWSLFDPAKEIKPAR